MSALFRVRPSAGSPPARTVAAPAARGKTRVAATRKSPPAGPAAAASALTATSEPQLRTPLPSKPKPVNAAARTGTGTSVFRAPRVAAAKAAATVPPPTGGIRPAQSPVGKMPAAHPKGLAKAREVPSVPAATDRQPTPRPKAATPASAKTPADPRSGSPNVSHPLEG